MNKSIFPLLLMLIFMTACHKKVVTQTTDSKETVEEKNTTELTSEDKISKAFAVVIVGDIELNLKMSKAEINAEAFLAAFKSGYVSSESMSPEEMKEKQEKVMVFMQMDTITNPQEIEEASSLIGEMIGMNIQRMEMPMNIEVFTSNFTAVMNGKDVGLTEEDAVKIMEDYLKAKEAKMMEEQAQKAKEEAVPNIKAGTQFLAENAKKEGVVTTASGLQYQIIKKGSGPKPTVTDKVKTHYHGTLINGTVFDSSVERGEPIEFPLGGVIKGWQEALQLMSVGAKYRLFIPHNLAYGTRSAGAIPAGSTLIFEVELLEIVK